MVILFDKRGLARSCINLDDSLYSEKPGEYVLVALCIPYPEQRCNENTKFITNSVSGKIYFCKNCIQTQLLVVMLSLY